LVIPHSLPRTLSPYTTLFRSEALKLAIDRYKANENVELVHYAQPLLNEADSLAKVMPSDIPLKQRRWLGLQMLEGDIYSRAYARSEEHTSELQSRFDLVCRLL